MSYLHAWLVIASPLQQYEGFRVKRARNAPCEDYTNDTASRGDPASQFPACGVGCDLSPQRRASKLPQGRSFPNPANGGRYGIGAGRQPDRRAVEYR